MEENEVEVKKAKIREQVGILLVCLVLAGSGALLIRGDTGTSPVNFVEGSTNTQTPNSSIEKPASVTSAPATNGSVVSSKININTASIEDLDKLPGVGPATAQKIIDYRKQNGPFPNIEAIDEVSGIGPSKYAQMKDLITI